MKKQKEEIEKKKNLNRNKGFGNRRLKMAILDDDDVNEVKNVNEQEIKMDSYIKKIIENVLEVQLKEHKEIASIAKTKIAEVTLELEKIKTAGESNY